MHSKSQLNPNTLVRVTDDAPHHAGLVGHIHELGEGVSKGYVVIDLDAYKKKKGHKLIAVREKFVRPILDRSLSFDIDRIIG